LIRYLCGVRSAGKTTLVAPLVEAATGHVVLDMDEVLEDGCVMGMRIAFDDAGDAWPAYNRHWVSVASLIARSAPLVLLGPLLPAEWIAAGGDPSTPFALLDCTDDVRVERLRARGWANVDIDDALRDAFDARAAIAHRIDTVCTVDDAVAAIVAWLSS